MALSRFAILMRSSLLTNSEIGTVYGARTFGTHENKMTKSTKVKKTRKVRNISFPDLDDMSRRHAFGGDISDEYDAESGYFPYSNDPTPNSSTDPILSDYQKHKLYSDLSELSDRHARCRP